VLRCDDHLRGRQLLLQRRHARTKLRAGCLGRVRFGTRLGYPRVRCTRGMERLLMPLELRLRGLHCCSTFGPQLLLGLERITGVLQLALECGCLLFGLLRAVRQQRALLLRRERLASEVVQLL
jgi:hypothetical protein